MNYIEQFLKDNNLKVYENFNIKELTRNPYLDE